MNEEQLIDILSHRRKTSDIGFALKSWNGPTCRYSLKRSPQQIKEQVLHCSKVKNAISEVSKECGASEAELEENAREILDEMSHNFQFRTIRFFGYVLSKFMKSVYGKILVDKQGIEKVNSVSKLYPIIYLPTHRSYSDFLLVSYVNFYFNLPVPVIAAGLDFLGLKFLSFLLRGAGAFFIRRSFVGDKLYREIFSAYVQTHVEGADFPMEFFIEGTRSRTAKSLVPKLGMLQVILDMYFSSKVPDITIVPISITYDRTLEETLYAYELIGVPKPKESTKGLIKARKVMQDFFGNVYIKYGDPISLKEYFHNFDRSIHNHHPRNMTVSLKKEQILCCDLANHIIHMHQSNLMLSSFPLICLVIGRPSVIRTGGVRFNVLVEFILWLQELVKKTGAIVYKDNNNVGDSVLDQLDLHSNILKVTDDSYVSLKDGIIQHPESSTTAPRIRDNTVRCAIPAIFAYHYGNQALQLLVHDCMICLTMVSCEENILLKSDIFLRYETLRKLLRREFVFERDSSERDFNKALTSLKEANIITFDGSKLIPVESNLDRLEFLSELLLPFLQSYHVICQHLIQWNKNTYPDVKRLALECQAEVESAIIEGYLNDYRCLSLDIINNCLTFLVSEGALSKTSQNTSVSMVPCHSSISNILTDLEVFLPPHKKHNNHNSRLSLPSAKL